ncbi:MAG: aminoglycoside 3'-phosphotransferase [Clostridiales bacterium]|nr:aminoglycoside 3'-phosphotransferase [Clostridiales bacterium]
MEDIKLPESIQEKIAGKKYTIDDIGKSESKVMIFDDAVLKIVKFRERNEKVIQMIRWMEGKVPAPRVLAYEREGDYQYLLMSKVKGTMSCDPYYMQRPNEMIRALADGMKLLWSVDISDCPRVMDLDVELKEARSRVENGQVDLDDAEPDTFGEGGFKDPAELLSWLETHRPSCEMVLSHGDYCLPNVFIEDGKFSGFIDLPEAGIGDKWRDIALCYRSLKHNAEGSFGGAVYPDIDPNKLFTELGIEPDWDKINYYILLDELF